MSRRVWLGMVFAATAATSAWLATAEDDEVEVVAPTRPRAVAGSPSRPDSRASQAVWPVGPAPRDAAPWRLESARAWVPGPSAAPAAQPVATSARAASAVVPQAPPFPYTLIGRIEDGATVHALFGGPQRTLGVRAADVIDGQWRVESIDAAGVTVTWLPGGVRQMLVLRPS